LKLSLGNHIRTANKSSRLFKSFDPLLHFLASSFSFCIAVSPEHSLKVFLLNKKQWVSVCIHSTIFAAYYLFRSIFKIIAKDPGRNCHWLNLRKEKYFLPCAFLYSRFAPESMRIKTISVWLKTAAYTKY